MKARAVAAGVTCLLLCACTAGSTGARRPLDTGTPAPTTAAPATPTYPVYGPTEWLCRPGMPDNPCEGRLDTVAIEPDGSRHNVPFQAAGQPTFDCFYVYPTVSTAKSRNAPLTVAPEIVRVVRAQAALFQRVCRLYAPLYRQVTLRGLFSGGYTDPEARALAQRDVASAFHDYLNRYNDGRPFLLLGHSQGATVLTQLVQTEVDGNPGLRSQLVSAMLIGGGPFLSPGSTTKGSFQNVPPCRSTTQTGCLVAYNTYDGTPPAGALFGRTVDDRRVVCVNPASPSGGSGLTDPIVPVPSAPGAVDVVGFQAYPDSVRARCRSADAETWLDVSRTPRSQLPDGSTVGGLGPGWGLHRLDVTIALGTLIDLAASQAAQLD